MAKKAKITRKTATKDSSITPEEAVSRLSLRHVRLLSVNSKLHIAHGQLPSESTIKFTSSVAPSSDGKRLHIDTDFSIHAVPENATEPDASFVHIELVYQSMFAMEPTLDLKEIQDSAEALGATGALVAWPYIREMVHSTSLRMGLPPFIVPLYSIGPGFQRRLAGVPGLTEKVDPKKRVRKKKSS